MTIFNNAPLNLVPTGLFEFKVRSDNCNGIIKVLMNLVYAVHMKQAIEFWLNFVIIRTQLRHFMY